MRHPAGWPDLVIFDCDGVLVDSELLSCDCLAATLSRHGFRITRDEVMALFLGRSSSVVAEHFEARTGAPLPERFGEDMRAGLAECFTASLQRMPGIEEVIAALDRPYCLATSSDPGRLSVTLSVTGLAELFRDRTFTASMVKRGKPAPDLFLHAAAAMGADPARALVVEDSVPGVLAAKAAGMTVWGFVGGSHYGGRDGAGLLCEAGADRVFSEMAEFSLA